MIAPREYDFRVLSIGLQHQEQRAVAAICSQIGGKYEDSIDEMDLYRLAQSGNAPVCIIGQSEKNPEPSYLVWLLKGIIHPYKTILIYNSFSEEESKKLDRFGAENVLTRPLDPDRLARMMESASIAFEARGESAHFSLSRLNPFRRHTKAK
jgi:hypothetical protein